MRNVRARALRPKEAHKNLRRMKAEPQMINDSQGNPVALNFLKHLVLNKPYKYPEYQREMIRYAQQNLRKNKEENEELDKETVKE